MYLAIVMFLIFILVASRISLKSEQFKLTKRSKTIILIGDSILNNENYVDDASTVERKLSEFGIKSWMAAADDAEIHHIFSQWSQIPYYIKENNDLIVVSIGGNNLLRKLLYKTNVGSNDVEPIWNEYKETVTNLYHKCAKRQQFALINLHYPPSSLYVYYYDIIRYWNRCVHNLCKERGFFLIDISLFSEHHIVHHVEPSAMGSAEIAAKIYSVL